MILTVKIISIIYLLTAYTNAAVLSTFQPENEHSSIQIRNRETSKEAFYNLDHYTRSNRKMPRIRHTFKPSIYLTQTDNAIKAVTDNYQKRTNSVMVYTSKPTQIDKSINSARDDFQRKEDYLSD
ncbi:unnamed protein product [Schistosoma turkestanicum]|nr:unnamed protein product [Schistosoma turkestanicum]